MKDLREYCTAWVLLGACALLAACTSNGERASADDADPALEALVDSLVPGLERLSGLERRTPLRTAMQPRAEARAFIERQIEKELPPERLAGMQASYAALGLIADTLDLRALLLALYTEQVIGYYDPESDRLYVVEGVDRTTLRPVLVHELVHALQDQYVNLDSLISSEPETEGGLQANDRQTAAQAAIEGHATLVMLAFLAEQMSGQTIDPLALPNPALQLAPAMQAQNSQFPIFRSAPAIIRETMIFPYVAGAGFVHTVWQARGAPTFDDLIPTSTEQVLHPDTRYVGEPDAPTELVLDAPDGWDVVYGNVLGEFETQLWLREYLGITASHASEGWDGDRFQLLATEQGDTALVWWSVWDQAAAARRFAETAARVKPFGRSVDVSQTEVDGRAVVRVTARVHGDAPLPEAPPRIR
ncbi:MAG: hypothetical protein ACREKM_03610 [Longimicrobiales bacterium]